jgi:hypothetical protein
MTVYELIEELQSLINLHPHVGRYKIIADWGADISEIKLKESFNEVFISFDE